MARKIVPNRPVLLKQDTQQIRWLTATLCDNVAARQLPTMGSAIIKTFKAGERIRYHRRGNYMAIAYRDCILFALNM